MADDTRPIRLIAEFFPTGQGKIDVRALDPIVRWFDSKSQKLEYARTIEKKGAHYETAVNVQSFVQTDRKDRTLPPPVLLSLYVSGRETSVATSKLIVLSRERLESAKNVLIDRIRGKR